MGSDYNAITPQWLLVNCQSIHGCFIRAWAPLLDFALRLHFFVSIWYLVEFVAAKFKDFIFIFILDLFSHFFAHLLLPLFGLLAATSIWCLLLLLFKYKSSFWFC
jgi:hypothetical protein